MIKSQPATQADAQALTQAEAPAPEEDFEIWPWHIEALRLFDVMQTQVRVAAGMAGLMWLGLDYAAYPQVFEELAIAPERQPELRRQVRLMEAQAVVSLNRRA